MHAPRLSPTALSFLNAPGAPAPDALLGRTLLVKYGGNAMTEPALQQAFAQDVVDLHRLGVRVVVVHGGGPQIEHALQRLGIEGQFVQGLRVTDAATLQVVQWVLCGQVQAEIVSALGAAGARAVGLSGRSAGLARAQRLRVPDLHDPQITHDVGAVGDITHVDVGVIHTLLAADLLPVVSPIAEGEDGQAYNVNADVMAGALAQALQAQELLLLTNIEGVLDAQGRLMRDIHASEVDDLVARGVLHGGMLPKMASALGAAQRGVAQVRILDGRRPHALLQAVLSPQALGTRIHAAAGTP